jgi:putative ABC transport system permease protein
MQGGTGLAETRGDMRSTQWLDEFRADVTLAGRQMRVSPGFTLVALVTLALGIGANSAMFALADAALIRALPFRDPERLVIVDEWGPQQHSRSRIELVNFREWARRSERFESMAAVWIPGTGGGATLTGPDGTPEMVSGQTVTADFFNVLGATPIAGRTFLPSDETSAPGVIVLSEGFWRRRFAADRSIVGRQLTLNGQPVTVIGIVPGDVQFAPGLGFLARGVSAASLWMLLPTPRSGDGVARGQCPVCRLLQVVGRLKPGVSADAGQAELALLADALAEQNGQPRPRRVQVTPLRDATIGRDVRSTAILLLGIVGLVLAICCANVANLLLGRGTARAREIAVRSTLGADRRRILKQLVTESLVLAALGGLLSLGLAAGLLRAAPSFVPPDLLPSVVVPEFNGRVAVFSLATALLVGVLFGLISAWRATGASIREGLAADSRTTTGHGSRLRAAIVIGEVAVAIVVLCGAGLLLRTLLVLDGFEPGYSAQRERLLSAHLPTSALSPGSRYPTSESLMRFLDLVERRVDELPAVQSAALATTLPLGGSQIGQQAFDIVGQPGPASGERFQADLQIVSAGFFDTLGLSMVAGRSFTADDRSGSVPVCIVNEAFVRRHFQGRNPIGQRIRVGLFQVAERQIVGVARQVKKRPDEAEEFVQLYLPLRQNPFPDLHLIVRASSEDASALAPAVRAAVAGVDRFQALNNVMTLEAVAGAAAERHRFRAVAAGVFATLALTLAMVGVFGVLAWSVQQRTREFGVRMAVGATAAGVLRLVFGHAARVVAVGGAIGIALATALTRTMSIFLFGVEAFDPLTYSSVAIVLVCTAALAASVPAWRATRVNPVEALRGD